MEILKKEKTTVYENAVTSPNNCKIAALPIGSYSITKRFYRSISSLSATFAITIKAARKKTIIAI
jgi:hypothetical protein